MQNYKNANSKMKEGSFFYIMTKIKGMNNFIYQSNELSNISQQNKTNILGDRNLVLS